MALPPSAPPRHPQTRCRLALPSVTPARRYAFLSGLAEPAAVVLLGLVFPSDLDKSLVDCLLAAVGGIMAFLALSELLPLSIEHAGRKAAIASLFGGMALMSANLYVLHEFMLPHDHDHGHDHEHHH
eukprot:364756-Chlamydomonas_euryale.AAC.7